MSIACPNIKSVEWRRLVNQLGETNAWKAFLANGEDVPTNEQIDELVKQTNQVNYTLKAVSILLSSKAEELFKKGKKNNWTLHKTLSELQIPKNQQDLVYSLLNNESSYDNTSAKQLALDLLANNSYTVEINTGKEGRSDEMPIEDNGKYFIVYKDPEDGGSYREEITKEEYIEKARDYKNRNAHKTYYSNMTVPGGTNYTENEISIPQITPSIKGHAQFSTDNGIGWFRSDEQYIRANGYNAEERAKSPFDYDMSNPSIETKTRRILEVQSDLFQKGRDNTQLVGTFQRDVDNQEMLIKNQQDIIDNPDSPSWAISAAKERVEQLTKDINNRKGDNKQNQFLQLLNKDNNWVTFFVKSIIQDSAKKGYEKVLFPTGNTASKVEGHQTLEEFKTQKLRRIDDLELDITNWEDAIPDAVDESHKKGLQASVYNAQNEIKQLKSELERVEKEGFAALKPIFKFYEETVHNILKKIDGVQKVTDEYNNTWYEVPLSDEKLKENTTNILLNATSTPNTSPITELQEKIETKLQSILAKIGVTTTFYDTLKDELKLTIEDPNLVIQGIYDVIDNVIKLAKSRGVDVLPEEFSHAFVRNLGLNHPIISRMYELIKDTKYYKQIEEDYRAIKEYQNEDALKLEAVGKVLGDAILNKVTELFTDGDKKNQSFWQRLIKMFKDLVNQVFSRAKTEDMPTAEVESLAQQLANKILAEDPDTINYANGDKELDLHLFPVQQPNIFDITKKIRNKAVLKNAIVDTLESTLIETHDYFKAKLDKVQKGIDDLNKKIKSSKDTENPDPNLILQRNELNKIKSGLSTKLLEIKPTNDDPSLTKYENLLFQLGSVELDLIKDKVEQNKYNLDTNIGKAEFTKDFQTVAMLGRFPGLRDSSYTVRKNASPYIDRWVGLELASRSNHPDLVTLSSLKELNPDINWFEFAFGALQNTPRAEGQLYGTLIKDAFNRAKYRDNLEIEKIADEQKLLQKWAKANNMSLQDAFRLLVTENQYGTLELVTKYKKEYYEARKIAFDTGNSRTFYNKEHKKRKAGQIKTDPLDKWLSSEYKIVQSTPALKRFYDFFSKTVEEKSKNLPVNQEGKDRFIPNMMAGIFDGVNEIKDVTAFKSLAGGLWNSWSSTEGIGLLKENREIPVKMTAGIPAAQKSSDLGDVLAHWIQFCNNYEEMQKIIPALRVIESIVEDKHYTEGRRTVSGVESRIYKLMRMEYNQKVRGVQTQKQGKIPLLSGKPILDIDGNIVAERNFYLSDFMHGAIMYTALLKLGFNPFNATNNIAVGTYNNMVEATGGRFFNFKDFAGAHKIYYSQIYQGDSKLHKIIDYLQPLQEFTEYNYLEGVKAKTGIKKITHLFSKDVAFVGQKWGENYLQGVPMIAVLLHEKENGASFWDLFKEDANGKLTWDKEKAGYELDTEKVARLRDYIQKINQDIHGRYSRQDQNPHSQFWWYQAAMLFHKWIPPAIESRVMGMRFDARTGKEFEGRWRTFGRLLQKGWKSDDKWGFWKAMFTEVFSNIEKLESGNKLTELEIYNMRKNLVEFGSAISLLLLSLAMGGDDDKKEVNAYYKFYLDQSYRLNNDITQFLNPNTYVQLIERPSPLLGTFHGLMTMLYNLPHIIGNGPEDYYKSGNREGENKGIARTIEMIPYLNQLQEMKRFGLIPFVEGNHNIKTYYQTNNQTLEGFMKSLH